jgi:hypothetical protein
MAERTSMQIVDMELRAMREVLKVIGPLSPAEQVRVLNWALERAKGPAVLRVPPAPQGAASQDFFPAPEDA